MRQRGEEIRIWRNKGGEMGEKDEVEMRIRGREDEEVKNETEQEGEEEWG
jgi:hypothetical protein